MKDRKNISEEYKWDLTPLAKSDSEVYIELDDLRTYIPKISEHKGKLKNPKSLYMFLELNELLSKRFEKISSYAYLKYCQNQEDKKYIEMLSKIELISHEFSLAGYFYESELMSYGDKYLKSISEDKKFANYSLDFLDLIRERPHILGEGEEKVVSNLSLATGGYNDVFDSFDAIDVKFDDVLDKKGKKHKVSQAEFQLLQENTDRTLRKNAFNSFYKGFKSMANTIATNYIASVKKDVAYANVYNFDSVLKSALFSDNLDIELYNMLIKSVRDNVFLLHKYYAIRKKVLKLKDFSYYDTVISLSLFDKKYTFTQCKDLVLKALTPLGDDYIFDLHRAFDDRWIDVYPNEGKSTGAFATNVYTVHPYVMLNTVNNLESAFTLAHELGHAMHSFYSSKLPYNISDYTIFLAEIASTTNEVLLLKYLYNISKNKKEKIYYLDKYLRMFKSTLFRQTMFSEFENYAHSNIEKQIPLSKEKLCEYYKELNLFYHGKSIKYNSNIDYEWIRIPHFYRSFYVYKYATGITAAINFASNILKNKPNALENYRELLNSGSKDYSYNLLKKAGVDLLDNKTYKIAFSEMEWALKELNKLLK